MTTVEMVNNDSQFFLKINGHSGYAEKGSDIVCASISSMSLMLVSYLDRVYGSIEFNEEDGELIYKTRKIIDNHSFILIETFKHFIEDLCEQYPRNVRYVGV